MNLPTSILAGRTQFAGACAPVSEASAALFRRSSGAFLPNTKLAPTFRASVGVLFGGAHDGLTGGVSALQASPSEVAHRNAFQRLAGGSSVVLSSFRMTDSGGQKVRPDLHVLASSLAVSAGPVGPFAVFTP